MAFEKQEDKTRISSELWDELYAGVKPKTAPEKDQLRQWLQSHIPRSSGTCLEIGCYPGRYLSVAGELGYRLYGVDMVDRLPELEQWLRDKGFRTGRFWNEDFFHFAPEMEFDLVLSLGFIEHYSNWEEVLEHHFRLVAGDGLLVLEAPNFIGPVQKWIHTRFDRENYERHYPEAMDIEPWCSTLERNRFEIVFSGYVGRFDFWVHDQERSSFQRAVLQLLRYIRPAAALLPPGSKSYSPYSIVLARKIP